MRDSIVAIALAGTARQERVTFTTGTPVDELVSALTEGEVERSFLLGAGAWAIYRQAGAQSQLLEGEVEPAAQESLRECTAGAALLISRLLAGEQIALLPEALARMREQHLRLPFRLLPMALNATGKETRSALFPLLGERGRWLSQFNSGWKWVNNYLTVENEGLPTDAEIIWQEGTAGQRVEILRLLRAHDPAKAREWLSGVWRQEKAELRSELLATFRTGLSAEDEPFLEKVLDDRASTVRAVAIELLCLLPASAFNERMRQRARGMVRLVDGKIAAEPPIELPADWQRDGLSEKSPTQLSPRAWWLLQVIGQIEPSFWEEHFGAPPITLFEMVSEDDIWRVQIIEGWLRATRKFGTISWLEPLWSWWHTHYQDMLNTGQLSEYTYEADLLKLMPAPMAERILSRLMVASQTDQNLPWPNLLATLPQPWSAGFARTYLRSCRVNCTIEKMESEHFNPYGNPWLNNLSTAALAFPVACLAEATQGWELSESSKWQVQYGVRQIKEFIETIQMREKINEEIC